MTETAPLADEMHNSTVIVALSDLDAEVCI